MQENILNVPKSAEMEKYLSFYLDREEYAINIQYVTDIISLTPITYMPKTPSYMKGIINLRGKIIPVIDLRIRFGKETIDQSDKQCIIVMEYDNIYVGILVDEVAEVADIDIDSIMNHPGRELYDVNNRFISGISKSDSKIKLLINCMEIFEIDNVEV